MFERRQRSTLESALSDSPAVVLLGPRQAGKTTLALEIAESHGGLYLDLESELDRRKLLEPEAYLASHLDRLVVLDEVHRMPGLFPLLRGLIDRARRVGRRTGLYLLLGSASLDLLRQSGESLAGRLTHLELSPFDVLEVKTAQHQRLWVRGGFPDSFLAKSDATSLTWRRAFLRTYLERDVPLFGPRIPAETLRRFWTMLAHHHGGLLNAAALARNLGVDVKTVGRYLDLLVDLLLVRRLPPWHANVGKRLVKSPKAYVRDSGIVHALLDIPDNEALLGHPVLGASWEGFVVENLLAVGGNRVTGHFYRTSGGAEIDLVLSFQDGRLWAVEIKRGATPKVDRGFHEACRDLNPARKLVVCPTDEPFPLGDDVLAVPLAQLAQDLAAELHGST